MTAEEYRERCGLADQLRDAGIELARLGAMVAGRSDELGGRALEWCKAAVYMKRKADEMDPRTSRKEKL